MGGVPGFAGHPAELTGAAVFAAPAGRIMLDKRAGFPYNNGCCYPGVAQLVARMVRDHEAVGSNPATRTMQSVLIGSEYPVMDTLLFYFPQSSYCKAFRGVAECYAFSCFHDNVGLRDFPRAGSAPARGNGKTSGRAGGLFPALLRHARSYWCRAGRTVPAPAGGHRGSPAPPPGRSPAPGWRRRCGRWRAGGR